MKSFETKFILIKLYQNVSEFINYEYLAYHTFLDDMAFQNSPVSPHFLPQTSVCIHGLASPWVGATL